MDPSPTTNRPGQVGRSGEVEFIPLEWPIFRQRYDHGLRTAAAGAHVGNKVAVIVTERDLGEALSEKAFTADQAGKLTNCTPHQLRYWDRVGLVSPTVQNTGGRPGVRRLYSFRDLVALRVVRSLLDNGMSLQRVRRAWEYLRRNADFDDHLASVKLVTDGQSIFSVVSDDGELLDALRNGQMAFFVAIDEIARDVEEDVSRFELDRDRFLEMLRRVEDDVRGETGAGGR